MKRMLGLAASLVLMGSAAHAQYAPPATPGYGNNQSAMSYINLLQPNVNPALTYTGIVQPQMQAQTAFQQLQGNVNQMRMMPGGVAPPRNVGVTDTGYRAATFMSYQQYFNTAFNARRGGNQTQPGTNVGGFGR